MALSSKDLEIETPCPINLDRKLSDGRHRAWGCSHCEKTVHVLSSMTERKAREFLREHEGQTLCITYMKGADGEIRFQPEEPVVPVSRLIRRRGVAAAGFAAALAACTPTEAPQPTDDSPVAAAIEIESPKHEPVAKPTMATLVDQARDKAAERAAEVVETEATVTELETVGTKPVADPVAIPMPGGIRVPHVPPPGPTGTVATATPPEDEPCDGEASPKVVAKKGDRPMRGGRRIR